MQTPKIASLTCDPYPVPYYHLVNGLHDPHQTWSYLFTGVEGDSHTSPCFVHELSHPNRGTFSTLPQGRTYSPASSKSLERALRDAMKSVLEKDGASDTRTSFYNKFKEEVDEYYDDLQEKHNGDMDATLIFVSFLLS